MTTAESWESLHSTEEFVAMQRVVHELFALLDGLTTFDWERATRCPPMDVRALVAHIAGSFAFARSWLIAHPEGPARIDSVFAYVISWLHDAWARRIEAHGGRPRERWLTDERRS
jgi:Mycothiol maleylpyruvate isomerase N-terminal domain